MNTALSVIEAGAGFDKLTAIRNSVGSEYLAFQTDKDTVLRLADIPLEKYYPRVILDYAQGQVMLMTHGIKYTVQLGHVAAIPGPVQMHPDVIPATTGKHPPCDWD